MSDTLTKRQYAKVTFAIGLYGAAVALAIIVANPFQVGLAFAIIGFLMAALAGIVTAPMFGHPKGEGWAAAVFAACVATFIGLLVPSFLLGIPWEAIWIGPILVFAGMIRDFHVFAVWCIGLICVHLYARQLREIDLAFTD